MLEIRSRERVPQSAGYIITLPFGNVAAEANDFTLKTNPKDTITMAGGTKLGGKVEALLEELIGIVKGGGHVYLDGSKVGSTLVLNSKLSN